MSSKPTRAISVLLIDDDEDDYLIIRHVFSRIPDSSFRLTWCASYEEAKQHIAAHAFDIYLIDYRLGEHSGLDLLRFAEPDTRSEPFILLTGVGDREIEKRSMELAAADYLVKGTFGPELLSRTLSYSLGRKQIEQQRIEHLIELSRTKDEFISLASHQLRTPATAVKQFLGMVLEGFVGEISDAQRAILQKAYENNERQLRIVSDLLKVAQVDAGKVTLRRSDVAVEALIKDVIRDLAGIYAARQQTVRYVPPKRPMVAHIDKERIRMVLENMLDNASKYSPPKTTVTISLSETPEMMCVAIQDEGVGIAPEDQQKLFEKFSRIYNPLSTQAGGTGLGLYWARKIVDLHGGSIEVSSAENQGTTFTVRLPKQEPPAMLKGTDDTHA